MPYPMIQCPTASEFCKKLVSEHDCRHVKDGDPYLNGSRITWLERTISDGTVRRYAFFAKDEERLAPSVVRL